jgi:hypothetical protein
MVILLGNPYISINRQFRFSSLSAPAFNIRRSIMSHSSTASLSDDTKASHTRTTTATKSSNNNELLDIRRATDSFDEGLWRDRIQYYTGTDQQMDKSCNPYKPDSAGNTSLIRAAAAGQQAIIRALLARKVDASARNQFGRNALMEAALWGRIGVIR